MLSKMKFLLTCSGSATTLQMMSILSDAKKRAINIHPARFPAILPEFFIKLLTDEGDTVLDFFAGSNTTGYVAEMLHRRWMALENVEDYLKASKFRFEDIKE